MFKARGEGGSKAVSTMLKKTDDLVLWSVLKKRSNNIEKQHRIQIQKPAIFGLVYGIQRVTPNRQIKR